MLLSDTDHIISAASDLSPSAFPSLSESTQQQAPASTSSSNEQQHPLKPYWEYLSFLFRRQPEPDPDQMLELSYRDYLQVWPCLMFCLSVLVDCDGISVCCLLTSCRHYLGECVSSPSSDASDAQTASGAMLSVCCKDAALHQMCNLPYIAA